MLGESSLGRVGHFIWQDRIPLGIFSKIVYILSVRIREFFGIFLFSMISYLCLLYSWLFFIVSYTKQVYTTSSEWLVSRSKNYVSLIININRKFKTVNCSLHRFKDSFYSSQNQYPTNSRMIFYFIMT